VLRFAQIMCLEQSIAKLVNPFRSSQVTHVITHHDYVRLSG
jgi:hypothetical protein